jgi:DNA-binding response OmpR family regulator
MLKSELEDMRMCVSVLVNEYDACLDDKGIIIADLDGDLTSREFGGSEIIGFSRNEAEVSKSVLNKCHSVFHRPFLIEDLKKTVVKLISEKDSFEGENILAVKDFQEDVRLKLDRECVYLDGKRIGLSGNEYALLKILYDNVSQPVSREKLNAVLSSSDGNMCDVYICHLRSKLEKGGSEKFIFTVRGKGYILKI